jgi:hypothetical protein
MIGNTVLATTTESKRQTHAEYEQGRDCAGCARIRAPIVRFCACKVAWMNYPRRRMCRRSIASDEGCPSNVTEPRTLWQEEHGVPSGGCGMVRAAAVPVADGMRAGVMLTIRVPDGFFRPIGGGGASATLLLNPVEARVSLLG